MRRRKEPGTLTRRQKQVLAGIVAGKNNVQIAQEIDRDPQTVKMHIDAIYARLQLGTHLTRTELAELAVERGLVERKEEECSD